MVLDKTLESPLDCKEIQPVNPQGNQSWIFTGRTEAEAPLLWPPDVKSWLTEKTLMLGKIEGRRRRGWRRMRWLDGITNQWTWVWVNSGSWWWTGGLACCNSWDLKESDMTEQLNWTEMNWMSPLCIKICQIYSQEFFSSGSKLRGVDDNYLYYRLGN